MQPILTRLKSSCAFQIEGHPNHVNSFSFLFLSSKALCIVKPITLYQSINLLSKLWKQHLTHGWWMDGGWECQWSRFGSGFGVTMDDIHNHLWLNWEFMRAICFKNYLLNALKLHMLPIDSFSLVEWDQNHKLVSRKRFLCPVSNSHKMKVVGEIL